MWTLLRSVLPAVLALGVLLGLAACGGKGSGDTERPSASDMLEAGRRPSRPVPRVDQAWRGEGSAIQVSVWEMHCDGCELEVETLLEAIEGVADARADHESAVVEIEITDPALREALIAKVREAVHEAEWRILGEDEIPAAE